MNESGPDRTNLTWQQLLAAYADGELDQPTRNRVEQRLAASPELARELRAQRRFSPLNEQFWLQVRPPDPLPEQWAAALQYVEDRLARKAEPNRDVRGGSRWLRRGLLALALALPTSAAASIALVVVIHSHGPPVQMVPVESDDGLLRLAQPDDIEIESLRHTDRGSLVVGEPPLTNSVTLAIAADVTLDGLQPDPDGAMPQIHMGIAEPAMIIAAPREP
jgi:hypothetical protein